MSMHLLRHAGEFLGENNVLGTVGGMTDTKITDRGKIDILVLNKEAM